MFQLLPTSAHELFRGFQLNFVTRQNQIARLASELSVHFDPTSHNGAFRFFPAGAQAAVDQCLVEAHSGTIAIEDNTPKGTVFVVSLPQAAPAVAEAPRVA